jgi:hypothetical protein
VLAAARERFSDAARLLAAADAVKVHIFTKPGITTHAELGRTGSHPDLTTGGSALPRGPRRARGPQPIQVSTCAPPAAEHAASTGAEHAAAWRQPPT